MCIFLSPNSPNKDHLPILPNQCAMWSAALDQSGSLQCGLYAELLTPFPCTPAPIPLDAPSKDQLLHPSFQTNVRCGLPLRTSLNPFNRPILMLGSD
ncbi:uncharacterized protein LACBIDRAFT_298270 [Laccaria bicolor S238N-H82]|uniref:Predicted protein n=1 Tax=Laccaria bicolor (strain S238N-H82 / ATCC MYA-4686) TaxID=486041 RepID=B0DCM0_LACBS|nr:uncharacterized protein LACBIDRAFT_298270 [Laccaria bicolor S238N-H82]EDR07753.1 predicted protein [Laccaria bicolor S238N-H82]|eukprot:XP_001881542.1 predicted protein [Laccaria bicolor S238N-H82]